MNELLEYRALSTNSPVSHGAFHRVNQLRRVVPDPILENSLNVLDVFNSLRRISLDQDQVRLLAGRDRSDVIQLSQILRAVVGRNMNRFHRRESRLNQQFHLPLITEAGEHAAHACRIQAREQQPAGLREGVLKFFFLLECRRPGGNIRAIALSDRSRIVRAHHSFQQELLSRPAKDFRARAFAR